MQQLVEYIARGLVDQPEAVEVHEGRSDRFFVAYHLTVSTDDFGKVIGRQGRVAKAMRTLLRAAGTIQGKTFALEIHEQQDQGEPNGR